MIKEIIQDAICNVINEDFNKSLYNIDTKDNVDNAMYMVKKVIAKHVQSQRHLSVETIAYEMHTRLPISVNTSRWYSAKLCVLLKKSKYKDYFIVHKVEMSNQWTVNIDIKAKDLDTVLTFTNYKIDLYNICKHQYHMYPKKWSIKYSLMSKTLMDKLYRLISSMNDKGDTKYDRALYANERQLAMQKLEFYDRINVYIDQVRNFTINSEGKMTCIPKGKVSIVQMDDNDNSVWKKQNRQEIKFGKAIRYILNQPNVPVTSDKMIQEITVKLQAEYTFDAEFKIVKGEDIRSYYHHSEYNPDSNTESLSNSCMRHSSCREYFDIYADNDNVSMLIAKTKNGIIGRAILWVTDCGEKLMDRIYGNSMTINNFKEWAKSNGYIHKYKQSYSNDTEWITSIGEVICETYNITLNNASNGYPYMDTFKYTDDIDGGKIVLTNDEGFNSYTFDSTDGGPWENRTETVDGCFYSEDEVRYIEYGTVTEGYYYEGDCFYCDYDSEWFHIDDSVETDRGYTVYRESDSIVFIENEDVYTHIDNAVYSEHEEQYIYIDKSQTCVINSFIWDYDAKTVMIDGVDYIVHKDVTLDELQEHLNNQ